MKEGGFNFAVKSHSELPMGRKTGSVEITFFISNKNTIFQKQ